MGRQYEGKVPQDFTGSFYRNGPQRLRLGGDEIRLLGSAEGYCFEGLTPHRFQVVDKLLLIISANISSRSGSE